MSYSFPRYLAAKKTVDDRALNRRVWDKLAELLASYSKPQIIEAGAGIGTMLERMLAWNLFQEADYTAIDMSHENIQTALHQRLPGWCRDCGYYLKSNTPNNLVIAGHQQRVNACFIKADCLDFASNESNQGHWDLLVAHAFLDLFDIPSILPKLLRLLRKGGLFYFSINFDGLSVFEPLIDPDFDEKIWSLYHRSMDERLVKGKVSGDSHSGRHLFHHLMMAGAEILEAGASDWVVFPRQGTYLSDEAYFLNVILNFIAETLSGSPDLDATRFQAWLAVRKGQIEKGELVFIAHQLDFVGRFS